MNWTQLVGALRPWTQEATIALPLLLVLLALRVAWDCRPSAGPLFQRRRSAIAAAGLLTTSVMISHVEWGWWPAAVTLGWLLLAMRIPSAVLSRSPPKADRAPSVLVASPSGVAAGSATPSALQKILHGLGPVLCAVFVVGGWMGVATGYAPMLSVGPSMWPTTPKGISWDMIEFDAYAAHRPEYGDDINFETTSSQPAHSEWPNGRYRKRVWALPGDHVRIHGDRIWINDKQVADCSDKSHPVAPTVWYCAITWPNGVTHNVTWGWSNSLRALNHTLSQTEMFVVGDNTVESSDSRDFGPINAAWVEGRFPSKRPTTERWSPWAVASAARP